MQLIQFGEIFSDASVIFLQSTVSLMMCKKISVTKIVLSANVSKTSRKLLRFLTEAQDLRVFYCLFFYFVLAVFLPLQQCLLDSPLNLLYLSTCLKVLAPCVPTFFGFGGSRSSFSFY